MCILSEGVSRRTVEARGPLRTSQYMRQTQFSLAAEPTQQQILALAISMKPFGRNALKLNGSVTVAVPANYTPHIMMHQSVFIWGKWEKLSSTRPLG